MRRVVLWLVLTLVLTATSAALAIHHTRPPMPVQLFGSGGQPVVIDSSGFLGTSATVAVGNITHITSVLHVAAATTLPVNCVTGCAGSSGQVIAHVSSVTHVQGNLRLINQAGTTATLTGTSLDVNCTAGCAGGVNTPVNQSGAWVVTAAHQGGVWTIAHISSALHIAGTVPITGTVTANAGSGTFTVAGTVTANQGGSWSVGQSGAWAVNVQHIASAVHVVGTVAASQAGTWTVQQGSPPWSVSQSGAWTIQPGNTANTTAWLVTGTGGTFPVTGTVTATQGAAGAAGWPVIASQGSAGNFKWPVDAHIQSGAVQQGAAGSQVWPVAAHQATQSGGVWRLDHITSALHVAGTISGAAFHVQGLGTPGQSHGGVLSVQGIGGGNPLAATQSGTWTVQPGNTANTTAWLVTGTGGTFPISGNLTGNQATNTVQLGGTAISMNTGIRDAGTQRVTIATNDVVPASQSGIWTVQPGNTPNTAAWLVQVQHISAAVHIGGTIQGAQFHIQGLGTPGQSHGGVLSIQGVGGGNALAVTQSGTWTVQPGNTANTTAWLVTGTGGTFPTSPPANASTNVTQFGGNAVVTGTGVSGLGIPRVTVSNDSTVILGTGAATIGALTANQSVNLAQVAGTATVTGGLAGSQAIGGTAATNAAINQNPVLIGAEALSTQPAAATTGNQRRLVVSLDGALYANPGGPVRWSCFVQAVTATTQCRAAPGAGLRAYVTSLSLSNQVATVQTLDLVFGTGTNCATGITAMTHKWQMGTNATTTSPFNVSHTFQTPLVPTAANAICVRPTASTAFGATLTGYDAP